MKIRSRNTLASVLAIVLSGWLFSGVFLDREWRDIHLFIKHRPSFKVFFVSPLGEADRSYVQGREGYLTPDQEVEESAYIEFVEEGGGYKRSITVF